VLSAVCAFPMFWLIDTRVTGLVLLGVTLGRLVLSVPYAVSGYLLAELFPARLRYSGVGLANNAAAIVSGFVPLIASALLAAAGGASWTAAVIVIVLALITLGSAPLVPRFTPGD
jgi:hypothetical protein